MSNRQILYWYNLIMPLTMMYLLTYLSFSDYLEIPQTHNLMVTSLIIYFPLLFIIQGIATALLKSNIYLPLGISLLSFVSIIFIWLNPTAFIYLFIYLAAGLLAYVLTRLILSKRAKAE